mmetsp:Transcript_112136/g.348036  ORF Transcript_112136/g.348036 Transcript_112136/m.348036 type:complete len:93 (-) Transcript_112136:142-420(-)
MALWRLRKIAGSGAAPQTAAASPPWVPEEGAGPAACRGPASSGQARQSLAGTAPAPARELVPARPQDHSSDGTGLRGGLRDGLPWALLRSRS